MNDKRHLPDEFAGPFGDGTGYVGVELKQRVVGVVRFADSVAQGEVPCVPRLR